jgi:hypothetical protein
MALPDPPSFIQVLNPTSTTSVVLGWPVPYDAGSTILDYVLEIELSGVWTLLQDDITALTYTYSPTVEGDTYTFRMKSRNMFGTSVYSDPLIATSGMQPTAPVLPTATVLVDNVIITWQTSSTHGVPITGFKIMIITSDGSTYAEELNSCDGSDPAIAAALTCTIPIVNLIVAPHNLVEGNTMNIKVLAESLLGDSDDSPINTDTVVVLVPATPVLINDFDVTT